jgi:ABC-type thiamin/hydroxymethylpyrimidine transport system permease subunit
LSALFASLGISLNISAGAVASGIYMIWPIIAYGLIRKLGAASMTSLTQAFISMLLPIGNFSLISIIYLAPGLAIDALFAIKHEACCKLCCVCATAFASLVGMGLVVTRNGISLRYNHFRVKRCHCRILCKHDFNKIKQGMGKTHH